MYDPRRHQKIKGSPQGEISKRRRKIARTSSPCYLWESEHTPDSQASGFSVPIHPHRHQTKKTTRGVVFLRLAMGYKIAIFVSLLYRFELPYKSRQSRVYHQDEVLHIINSVGIVYHHCERGYSLRLMICTFGDEIHAKA